MGNEKDWDREPIRRDREKPLADYGWKGINHKAQKKVSRYTPVPPGFYVRGEMIARDRERIHRGYPLSNLSGTKEEVKDTSQNKSEDKPSNSPNERIQNEPSTSTPQKQNWLQRWFGGGQKNQELKENNKQGNKSNSLSEQKHPEQNNNSTSVSLLPSWIKKRLGSDPGVYTGLHPETRRENPQHEKMRQWTINIIKENAQLIIELGQEYNIPPEAIAGAILWEGIENPYNWLRGQGPLIWTRPGGRGDFGIPGKIHVGANDIVVAPEVEKRLKERRPDAFEPYVIAPSAMIGGNVSTEELTIPYGLDALKARLLDDPSLAIEYSAAIIDVQAESFESEASATRREIGSSLNSYNIRNQAGLLSSFYQGVDPESAARSFETRRLNDPDSKPRLPEADASMGPWVSQYRNWITELLKNNSGVHE